MNRRISAVRGLFEHQATAGVLAQSPVPAARVTSGLRISPRGLLGHVGAGRPAAMCLRSSPADFDLALGWLRVLGKGGRERIVPSDFAERVPWPERGPENVLTNRTSTA